jgi:rod shape determining protein RodA
MPTFFSRLNSYFLRRDKQRGIDWILFSSIMPLLGAGLVTMYAFMGNNQFFVHQVVWILISISAFFVLSELDFRFLRSTWVSVTLFSLSFIALISLFLIGKVSHGASSWFSFGAFSLEPADPAKLVLIILLAKYFSRRHIEIRNVRHIIVSGFYTFVMFSLILVQPDLGSALIVFLIWLGMIMVSGVSKKHLLIMGFVGLVVVAGLWHFGLHDYQKARIENFIHPLADIQGAGYNAYESTIAVGSGQFLGKGVGYGTQSRLKFLPEYQTDFVFAAFAEEWGFVGVLFLLFFFGILIWRIIKSAMAGATNFEILYGAGVAIYFLVHLIINIGMNMRLLPVTGTPLPFVSYGGSHIFTEFVALGILMGMRRYNRTAHKDATEKEIIGPR